MKEVIVKAMSRFHEMFTNWSYFPAFSRRQSRYVRHYFDMRAFVEDVRFIARRAGGE